MSVLLGRDTRVIVQGMGREGTFHATRMREYGTKVVGGVVPGSGGTTREGFPVFDTVRQAVEATEANASIIFVPATGAMDAAGAAQAVGALVDLAADIPGVGNLHVSAREWHDSVVFLRKIEPGGSDRSFGIQVARLAGLPAPVIVRAQEILGNLERTEFDREGRPRLAHSDTAEPAGVRQLALFSGQDEAVLAELRRVDTDGLTPLQALALLAELQRRLGR